MKDGNTNETETKMTTEEKLTVEQIALIEALTPEKIGSVYSGKPGCACGCRGNYRYNPTMVAQESERRGYAITADEVNFTQIKKVLKMIQEAVKVTPELVMYSDEYRTFVSLETENRVYTIYPEVQ